MKKKRDLFDLATVEETKHDLQAIAHCLNQLTSSNEHPIEGEDHETVCWQSWTERGRPRR